jgi:hypothetical protein
MMDLTIDVSDDYKPHRQSWLEGWFCARNEAVTDADVEAKEGWRVAFGDDCGAALADEVSGGSEPVRDERADERCATPRGLPGSTEWLEDVLAHARRGAALTSPTSEVGVFFRQEVVDLTCQLREACRA